MNNNQKEATDLGADYSASIVTDGMRIIQWADPRIELGLDIYEKLTDDQKLYLITLYGVHLHCASSIEEEICIRLVEYIKGRRRIKKFMRIDVGVYETDGRKEFYSKAIDADVLTYSIDSYVADMCKPVSRAFGSAIYFKHKATDIHEVTVDITQFDADVQA